MLKSMPGIAMRVTALLIAPLATSCTSGGGIQAPAAAASPSAGAATTTSSTPGAVSRIPAGPIAAALPATFGAAPAQIATGGNANFDNGYLTNVSNVTFPLATVGLQAGATSGIAASVGDPSATATVVAANAYSTTLQFNIPSLNLNTTVNFNQNIVTNDYNTSINPLSFTWGYNYVALGYWEQSAASNALATETHFMFGFETPATAMPTSGSASYAGIAEGTVFKSSGTDVNFNLLEGTANISANFTNGRVTGALTQIKDGNAAAWNDVSINANIAAGSNRFSGTTAVTSTPGTPFSLAGTASGHVDGAFYGPTAQNIGALWSLSDGNVSAIGTLAGKQ